METYLVEVCLRDLRRLIELVDENDMTIVFTDDYIDAKNLAKEYNVQGFHVLLMRISSMDNPQCPARKAKYYAVMPFDRDTLHVIEELARAGAIVPVESTSRR